MNIEKLVKEFDPITLVKFKNYLSENLLHYCSQKNSNSKIVSTFKEKNKRCEKCYGKLNKNGKTKTGIQKYICSSCKATYSETTNTVIYHSKLPFSVWANIIDNLVDGFSIRRIAEQNNIFLKIAGLGKCSKDMFDKTLKDKIRKVNSMTTDSARAYQSFCMENLISLHQVPSGQHSRYQININSVNGVHSQLTTWLSKFRGVSTRHLQEYLNWFNYIFTMKKRFTLANLKIESYINLIINNNYIKTQNIVKKQMPIDLSIAYAEYNHQS